MMMRMLEAGGVPPLVDGVRTADVSNPNGYFEFEPVKALDKNGDLTWLPTARGRAVKIISFLLTWLPETYDYRVIFMHRAPRRGAGVAAGDARTARRGRAATRPRAREIYTAHLAQVERFMAARSCFRALPVHYREAVADPAAAAARVAALVGRPLDHAAMVDAVDGSLYRNRA